MNCREFRRRHDAYIDDTLCGADIEGMTRHLRFCAVCAALDTRVRRALLLAHNIPVIHPSAAFNDRLQARLAEERMLMRAGRVPTGDAYGQPRRWPMSAGAYTMIATVTFAAAGLAGAAAMSGNEADTLRLAPVVASLPAGPVRVDSLATGTAGGVPSPLAAPAMIAAMPAGLGLWPAVYVAQQAPWHFASVDAGR